MKKIEIQNLDSEMTEKQYKLTPDENKCFQSKLNGHKFIHTNGKQGLPLYVSENEIDFYEEVNI